MPTLTAPEIETGPTTTVNDVTCVRCGCLCDDLIVHIESGTAKAVDHACPIAQSWFLQEREPPQALAFARGREIAREEAVEEAATILLEADFPWIDGIANTTVEAQRVLLDVAALAGGLLSGPGGNHGRALDAVLTSGMVTATLGEVKNRADVLLLWDCDPTVTHPRHFERYSAGAVGRWTPNGRADRTVIALGSHATRGPADPCVPFAEGRDFEAAWTLRALLRGLSLDAVCVEQATGVPLDAWTQLADVIQRARYGAILHDPSVHSSPSAEHATRAILDLIVDLNRSTSFSYVPLVGPGNPTGADQVTAWTTGTIGSLDFSDGSGRPWRGGSSVGDILRNRVVDAGLLVQSDPMSDCMAEDWQWLGHIPTIVLTSRSTPTSASAAVSFMTAEFGRGASGTVFRSDGVCLPVRPWAGSELPSDQEILEAIRTRMVQKVAPVRP